MIDRSHGLSLTRQAQLMRISRGSLYYRRKPPCESHVQLMRSLDALHAAHPFAGARMLRGLLQRQGFGVGRRHIRTVMQGTVAQTKFRASNPKPSRGYATAAV